jgi:murein DD-endopeptidase MepM/ murein hydrolase activator NlpD
MTDTHTLGLHHWLNHRRLMLIGGTLMLVGGIWSLLDSAPAPQSQVAAQIIELALPERVSHPPGPAGSSDRPAAGEPEYWETVTVRSGQSLDAIFRKQGFSVALLHRILALNGDTKGLVRIRPGDTFDFRRDADGGFAAMRSALGEDRYLLVRLAGETLHADTQPRHVVSVLRETEGVIHSSLFQAGKEAGLSDQMVMKLANIFGWDIDFVQDLRDGDRFLLVYEKIYRDGEFLRDGQILAATFLNQGQRFQAIWFDNGEIAEYFAPDGRPMRKAFLRAPLNFSYISSGFNPRRMHPVLKRLRPHNGIDYYAPKGTPVYAAGAGTVTRSAYSAANGHHVFIQHTNSIVTKYLHFTSRAVQQGQKVRQGQTIGYVGSTGLATGPHLHYEFVLNGVHRNPRTVPLPKVEPLQGALLTGFQQHAAPMLSQLSRLESASLYASRE